MKTKTIFVCSNCGYESSKWLGKCPACNEWNSFYEEKDVTKSGTKEKRKERSEAIQLNKVEKKELIVDDFYKEQAKLILTAIDDYLEKNKKVYNDLQLYWPFYKAILKRIAIGKKFNGKDYKIIEKIKNWQQANYEDAFLMNIYDVLIKNIV